MDRVFDATGGFGFYQKVSCGVLLTFMYGVCTMETVFTSTSPNFWWQQQEENLTVEQIKNRTGVCREIENNGSWSGKWQYEGEPFESTIVTQVSAFEVPPAPAYLTGSVASISNGHLKHI